METCKAYWHIFALTGSVDAYLLYRELIKQEIIQVASTSESLE